MIDGFDPLTFDVTPTSVGTIAFGNRKLRRNNNTITGNGTATVFKTDPTTTALDEASVLGSFSVGDGSISPSSTQIFNRNAGDVQVLYDISGLELGDVLLFEVEDTI